MRTPFFLLLVALAALSSISFTTSAFAQSSPPATMSAEHEEGGFLPRLHADLAVNQGAVGTLSLRYQSRYVQPILEAGIPLGDGDRRYGFGLGTHFRLGTATWLEIDNLYSFFETIEDEEGPSMLGELRATFGYQLKPRMTLFASAMANVLWTQPEERGDFLPTEMDGIELAEDSYLWVTPGARVGIRF